MRTYPTTCGHQVYDKDNLFDVSLRAYTRHNARCVDFVRLCKECYTLYKVENLVLYTERERSLWLKME